MAQAQLVISLNLKLSVFKPSTVVLHSSLLHSPIMSAVRRCMRSRISSLKSPDVLSNFPISSTTKKRPKLVRQQTVDMESESSDSCFAAPLEQETRTRRTRRRKDRDTDETGTSSSSDVTSFEDLKKRSKSAVTKKLTKSAKSLQTDRKVKLRRTEDLTSCAGLSEESRVLTKTKVRKEKKFTFVSPVNVQNEVVSSRKSSRAKLKGKGRSRLRATDDSVETNDSYKLQKSCSESESEREVAANKTPSSKMKMNKTSKTRSLAAANQSERCKVGLYL